MSSMRAHLRRGMHRGSSHMSHLNQVHTQGIFDEDEGMLGDCGSLKAHFDPDGVC